MLAKAPQDAGAPAGFASLTRTPAAATPIAVAEVFNAIDDGDVDMAIRAFRESWKKTGTAPVPEGPMNFAGYLLLGTGRPAEGLRLLELNPATRPRRWS
jgi:hypothetical protein